MCGGRGLQAGTLFSPAFPSHPHRPYVSSCTMSCPIDFPFHVSLTLLPLHPQKWSLLPFYTPAHTPHQGTHCAHAHTPGGQEEEAPLARSGQR